MNMKRTSKGSGPIWPGDSDEIKKTINEIEDRGFKVDRRNEYHIKIGTVSYWLSGKGKIMIDPCDVLQERGLEALLDVLEAKVPKRLNRMPSITLDPELKNAEDSSPSHG